MRWSDRPRLWLDILPQTQRSPVHWSPQSTGLHLIYVEASSTRHTADTQEIVTEPRKWKPTPFSYILLLHTLLSNFKVFSQTHYYAIAEVSLHFPAYTGDKTTINCYLLALSFILFWFTAYFRDLLKSHFTNSTSWWFPERNEPRFRECRCLQTCSQLPGSLQRSLKPLSISSLKSHITGTGRIFVRRQSLKGLLSRYNCCRSGQFYCTVLRFSSLIVFFFFLLKLCLVFWLLLLFLKETISSGLCLKHELNVSWHIYRLGEGLYMWKGA